MPFDVELPNGNIIEDVPDGTTKEEVQSKAIATGLARQEDFMSTSEKALVGVGRGLTDIGQTGRQLFEQSPLGGMTDVSAEDYQKRVASERDTYEEGLGEDTAASLGRLAGQVAPTIPLGGIVGMGARGLGAARGAAATTEAIAGGVAGGASTEVGEDIEDIAGAGLTGGVVGGVAQKAFPALGAAADKMGIPDKLENLSSFLSGGNLKAALVQAARRHSDKSYDDLVRMYDDETATLIKKVADEGADAIDLDNPAHLEIADELSGGMTESGKMTPKSVASDVWQESKRVGREMGDPGSLMNMPARDVVAGGVGAMVGGVPGAIAGVAASRTLPITTTIVRNIGISASDTTAAKIQKVIDYDPQLLGKYARPLQEAANRGASSLAATMHVLQQTDPAFRAKIEQFDNPSED